MKTVLFACVHNAGRSQMAAAWFDRLADPSKARAISAGTAPGAHVHPGVVASMREVGIDLSGAHPTLLTDALARESDLLVTMGCGEACPAVPGLRREDWPLEDPKDKPLERVREIRTDIARRVRALAAANGWTTGRLRAATPDDRAAIEGLLQGESLPTAGVADAAFRVVEDGGRVIGTGGLETHGDVALLRSVVVHPDARGRGVAETLVNALLDDARALGLRDVFLLTATARTYFEHLGFVATDRARAPETLLASEEMRCASAPSATLMHLPLRGK